MNVIDALMGSKAIGTGQLKWPKPTTPLSYRFGYQSFLAEKPCQPPFGYTTASLGWRAGWLDGQDDTFGKRKIQCPADHERLWKLEQEFKG